MQLDKPKKGFSFQRKGPLDMRMDSTQGMTAADVVNGCSEEELGEIFLKYGEEYRFRRAAKAIVERRKKRPIETTTELAELLKETLGRGIKKKLHPATLIFQALRIYVNRELESIEAALPKAIKLLRIGGRIGAMSFHRLEDRIVKGVFKEGATVPAQSKYKEYVQKPTLRLLSKKPLVADEEEVKRNPRSRSAKLRFAERVLG